MEQRKYTCSGTVYLHLAPTLYIGLNNLVVTDIIATLLSKRLIQFCVIIHKM